MPLSSGVSGPFSPSGRQASAGATMGIGWIAEQSSFPLQAEASIWSAESYAFVGVSKEFTASSASGTGSPITALFAFANNNGATSDVVAFIADSVARSNNAVVFGANIIARNASGASSTKLVGLEIDVEPASGTTVAAGTAGLYLNIFNLATAAPAIQVGGVGGGTWANGIIVNAVTGAGLSAQSGSAMASLIDATNGTYNTDAVVLGNTQKLRLSGTGTTHARLYNDTSNNIRLTMGSGGAFAVRDAGDQNNLFLFESSGTLTASNLKFGTLSAIASETITGYIVIEDKSGVSRKLAVVS